MSELELLDDNGENLAVRTFLQLYGCTNNPTVKRMREHLRMSGFDGLWPAWVDQNNAGSSGHLTKSGAQDWLRYLFGLERQIAAQQVEDAVGAARYRVMREHVGAERTNNGSGSVSFYLYTTKTPPLSCKIETDAAIDAYLQAGKE